jgi:outer membrane lipopolysaccharide assembly protein LptE/RlpB
MRLLVAVSLTALLGLAGCGYHTLGTASHLPPDLHTLSVPVFANKTDTYAMETALTGAVIREFNARTSFRIVPTSDAKADAVLIGTIRKESVTPLTYNASTQQSSSFLITLVIAVTLKDHDGRVLYSNNNYVFRQQYESTTVLPTFLQEDSAGMARLSRDFARQLVADVLEGY